MFCNVRQELKADAHFSLLLAHISRCNAKSIASACHPILESYLMIKRIEEVTPKIQYMSRGSSTYLVVDSTVKKLLIKITAYTVVGHKL